MTDDFASLRGILPPEFLPAPTNFSGPYRVFSTEHDLELRGSEVEAVIGKLPKWGYYPSPDFASYWRAAGFSQMADEFRPRHANDLTSDVAISILIDHSGSLRGEKSCLVAAIAGVVSHFLVKLGVRHEILGFTTSTWYGGESKFAWRRAGCPPAPGRLCDVLHVVHRDFTNQNALSEAELNVMTRSGLLKENVDGEALEWASSRLQRAPESRRILLVVSDGAPADDATLEANGPNILDDHLIKVTEGIIRSGQLELYGVGIEYDMSRYYPQFVTVQSGGDISRVLLPTFNAILMSRALAPCTDQISRHNLESK